MIYDTYTSLIRLAYWDFELTYPLNSPMGWEPVVRVGECVREFQYLRPSECSALRFKTPVSICRRTSERMGGGGGDTWPGWRARGVPCSPELDLVAFKEIDLQTYRLWRRQQLATWTDALSEKPRTSRKPFLCSCTPTPSISDLDLHFILDSAVAVFLLHLSLSPSLNVH